MVSVINCTKQFFNYGLFSFVQVSHSLFVVFLIKDKFPCSLFAFYHPVYLSSSFSFSYRHGIVCVDTPLPSHILITWVCFIKETFVCGNLFLSSSEPDGDS